MYTTMYATCLGQSQLTHTQANLSISRRGVLHRASFGWYRYVERARYFIRQAFNFSIGSKQSEIGFVIYSSFSLLFATLSSSVSTILVYNELVFFSCLLYITE